MAASFGVGSRVSAAVFSNGFEWLTKGSGPVKHEACPDERSNCARIAANGWCSSKYSQYWKTNQKLCPKSCKTGKLCKVESVKTFTSPEKAAAAVALARWPKGSTNTAGALTKTLAHIKSRGTKGAKQIVYIITDGEPNSVHDTALASAKLRKVARLAFIPVGQGAPVSRMKSWASKPTSANVFYAKNFKALNHQLRKAVKSTCKKKKNELQKLKNAEKEAVEKLHSKHKAGKKAGKKPKKKKATKANEVKAKKAKEKADKQAGQKAFKQDFKKAFKKALKEEEKAKAHKP